MRCALPIIMGMEIPRPTLPLSAIQDLDILEAACQLDANLDGQLDQFEIDAGYDGSSDAFAHVSRNLTASQFAQFETLLRQHAIPVRAPTEPHGVPSITASVAGASIFDVDPNGELPALPMTSMFKQFQSRPNRFVPEYDYRAFLYNHAGVAKDSTCVEMRQLAQTILTLKSDASVYLATDTTECLYPLDGIAAGSRVHLSGSAGRHRWMQDAGEPLGGSARIFVSGAFDDRRELSSAAVDRIVLPVSLPGGNVTKTMVGQRKTLVVGHEIVKKTIIGFASRYEYALSAQDVATLLATIFGADQVIVLRNTHLAFHIDQQVFFPKAGVAVMPRILPQERSGQESQYDLLKYEVALAANREILRRAGFEIIEIPITPRHVSQFQAYTNSIVLTTDDATHIIMPSFAEPVDVQRGPRATIKYPPNAALEPTIQTILESHGFHVHFVRNTTFPDEGNSHCLTGVLE